ncbi:MAG: transglutaminase-like domain-containing protein [Candidatus Micrarchaeota archaeon]
MSDRRLIPNPILLFAFLLLFLPLVHSALDAGRIVSASYYIIENQSIDITTGTMSNLSINLTLPADARIVTTPPGSNVVQDADGNLKLQISEPAPKVPYHLFVNATVSTNQSVIDSLPDPLVIPGEISRYLGSTPQVPASDPKYRALAMNITQNATSPFERLALLARWVNSYITYDADYVSKSPSADEILASRRGVCTEYATLFTTLSRSLGYPTRFVNGYAYSDQYSSWLGHAWTEVYLGRWVPVDPTWMEVGRLDATHIVSSRQAAQDFKFATVSALVYPPSADIVWEGAQSQGVLANNIHLVSSSVANLASQDYRLGASSTILPPGARFLVFMSYPSEDYHLLRVSLAPCISGSSVSLVQLDDPSQDVIAAPNKTFQIIWTGRVGDSLESNVQYSCPLTLNSNYLPLQTMPLNITSDSRLQWPLINATLRSDSIQAGQKQSVFVRLPVSMAGKSVTLLESDRLMRANASEDGSVFFEFYPDRIGPHALYVFSTLGAPVEFNYTVRFAPGLDVSEPIPEQPLVKGEPDRIGLRLADSSANVPARRLEWSWGAQSGELDLPSGSSSNVSILFTPAASGSYFFTVTLRGPNGEVLLRNSWPLEATEPSSVSVAVEKVFALPDGQWQAHIYVNRTGVVNDPYLLLLDGRAISIPPDGHLAFNIPSGTHECTIVWHDSLRQEKRIGWSLEVSSATRQPEMDALTSLLTDSKSFFIVSAGVFLILICVFGFGLYFAIRRERLAEGARQAREAASTPDDASPSGASKGPFAPPDRPLSNPGFSGARPPDPGREDSDPFKR